MLPRSVTLALLIASVVRMTRSECAKQFASAWGKNTAAEALIDVDVFGPRVAITKSGWEIVNMRLEIAFILVLFPQGSQEPSAKNPPVHEEQTSKIPAEEAQFTPEQLEQYYLVYKNADVRYLRTLFDAYLEGTGGTAEERESLKKWDMDYYRSKFVVMSRDKNTFGGTLITIMFQDRPDKVFVAWVYEEASQRNLALRRFEIRKFSGEDLRRMRIRYRKLLEDKTHAM
jgi:hypothetical protein